MLRKSNHRTDVTVVIDCVVSGIAGQQRISNERSCGKRPEKMAAGFMVENLEGKGGISKEYSGTELKVEY
jgi:hypothetical protein